VTNQILFWVIFNLFVLAMLILDLKVFHRKAHVIHIREALLWSAVWIAMALAFNIGIYFWYGSEKALQFLTGYLIEKSLSMDNIFVFLLIFSYFEVPPLYQHKVLFWGVFGAIVLRAIFIIAGVALISRFHWIIYVFGAFLIFIGIKMALEKEKKIRPEKNPVLRLFRRFIPVLEDYEGDKFFVKRHRDYFATPLAVVLLVVETTDIIFAVDSIPAILAITSDPLIVYTSNIFAILGLRALYFAFGELMRLFRYLHYGLAIILVFVGIKMVLADFYKIPVEIALGVVAIILFLSVMASRLWPRKRETEERAGETV
jgi:tellurite resistance protein TerC